MTPILLKDIYIYPIKSLGGIRLSSWPVTKTGFKYDRNWMLIDAGNQFLSQRRLPRMALIKTNLTEQKLVVSAPGMNNLSLALEPAQSATIRGTIWNDRLDLWAVSAEADAWFRHFLEVDCRLVYQPAQVIRQVDQRYARAEDRTSLSDGFPFLIISEASLEALNNELPAEIGMERFRPNLVVSGCPAYAEDTWREITIGDIGFRLPKPSSRCAVPTINSETAKIGKEPLTTLNRLRKWNNKVYFGQNAVHDDLGVLSVGDQVMIRKTGANQPPL